MKHTITLKFNKLPENCSVCPLQCAHEDDESFFGDGVTYYCPFGGDLFGSAVERPKNCPIGTVIEVDEPDKPIETSYKVDKKLFEEIASDSRRIKAYFEEPLTRNQLVDKIMQPQTMQDLYFIAECCHYKRGWAYYEAQKLNIEIPSRKNHYYSRRRYNNRYYTNAYYDEADYSDYDFGITPWGDS